MCFCVEIVAKTNRIASIFVFEYILQKEVNMKSVFEGCGVALVTPFKDKEIDFENLKKIIDNDLHKGAKAIVVLATTGEGTTISETEREQIIKFCRKLTFRKAKLIIGTGNNNFEVCKRYTKMAKKLGADAALVVTPYYNKTTQTGLVKYYQNLAKLKFPMIMYNVPSRTGLMIELDTVKKIIETNQYVYGIKESTTDIARISKLCEICKNKIAVYSGEDALNFVFYCLGGSGAVSVTANIFADKVQKVYDLTKTGKIESALELQRKLFKIDDVLFCETNPVPVKYFMSLCAGMSEDVRLPLVKLSNKNKSKVKKVFELCSKEKWFDK